MRSLRSGVSAAVLVAMWSSTAFGFSLFGSDTPEHAPKPAVQQTQPQADSQDEEGPATIAKTLAANLDGEVAKAHHDRLMGDYDTAAHALAQMMIVAPDDPRVISEYGKVMVSQGRTDDAIAFLKRAVQLSPNDWTLYSAIGAAFDQKSDFTDARTAYERGLQIDPKAAPLLNNYAMSRMLAGDLPGAQQLIARAQTAGHDPMIAHNAALMTNLRGGRSAQQAVPAQQVAITESAAPKPAPVKRAAAPVHSATVKPKASTQTAAIERAAAPHPSVAAVAPRNESKPHNALPKPVRTAELPPPAPVKAPVATAGKPVLDGKAHIVTTASGRVMMQTLPKEAEAPPVKTAEAAPEAAKIAPANGAPRALAPAPAPAAPASTPHVTPDLRAAAD